VLAEDGDAGRGAADAATKFTEPVETCPETVGTGPTDGRFPIGPNSNFEFEFKK
jgi:hypothetical protein